MLAHSHPQTVRKQNKPLGRKRNLVQSCLKLSLNNRKCITERERESEQEREKDNEEILKEPGREIYILVLGILRQEYWNGMLFPPPRDLSNPEIEPGSSESLGLQADSLPTEALGKPHFSVKHR